MKYIYCGNNICLSRSRSISDFFFRVRSFPTIDEIAASNLQVGRSQPDAPTFKGRITRREFVQPFTEASMISERISRSNVNLP